MIPITQFATFAWQGIFLIGLLFHAWGKFIGIAILIFAIITVFTLTVMAIFYLRLPATFGIGTYGVSADFTAGGGLYKNANVTYRGVAVGRVRQAVGDGVEPRDGSLHRGIPCGLVSAC